ncbi:hypothetical protein CPJCM30710_32480 [Clostridium polyendosporum]|uniref:Uncharacterized protein n=1 Tax=Clostridium polyendosporum TaxID=69208 RepID=A0A919S1V7_9CLOT|nr:hypothetical protein [Clostridium polyendosporum]GIM30582.1 hypothetical protein CPJCM30710_32480 [Clostridium polyendosporum]
MSIIIILLLLLALACTYLYFDKKLTAIKHQLFFINKQYKALKNKYSAKYKSSPNVYVKYSIPSCSSGVTQSNAILFLAPIATSPVINNINEKLQVTILDEAEINNEKWFFVSLPLSTNVNSKGWIKKTDFSLIFSNSKEVINQ